MALSDLTDLLNGAHVAVLVTVGPDGSPQAAPVWYGFDGETVSVSTTSERQKYRNIVRDPRVSFTLIDPANTFRYVEIRGRVTVSEDPGGAEVNAIARKHGLDDASAFDEPGSRRLTLTITPDRIIEH